MWKRTEEETETPYQPSSPNPPRPAAAEPRGRAVIGESIRVEGDVSGEEDLLVQGQVEGKIDLAKNNITVGRPGRVKADIHGRSISVEGKVQGNLFADEQVVVRESGEVRGNITAPRVSLEDGAKFKGSIDMEPKARPDAGATGRDAEPKARTASSAGPQGAAPGGGAPGGGGASAGAGGEEKKPSSPDRGRAGSPGHERSGSPVAAGAKA